MSKLGWRVVIAIVACCTGVGIVPAMLLIYMWSQEDANEVNEFRRQKNGGR